MIKCNLINYNLLAIANTTKFKLTVDSWNKLQIEIKGLCYQDSYITIHKYSSHYGDIFITIKSCKYII